MVGYNAGVERDQIDKENLLQYIAPQDLKSFGLIPELVGRFPVVTYLDPLDRHVLRKILTDPKNAVVKQFVKLFAMDNIKLTFDESVFEFIVDKAVEYKVGARGLRSILEAILTDAMFELPSNPGSNELHITTEYAREKLLRTKIAQLSVA